MMPTGVKMDEEAQSYKQEHRASRSLTQPLLDCIRHNIYMIQALYQALQISVSLGKCV